MDRNKRINEKNIKDKIVFVLTNKWFWNRRTPFVIFWGAILRKDFKWEQRYNKMKDTLIISAFPACGKTYFYNKFKDNLKVLDSDSSLFDKSEFPRNYIEYIKSNLGKADIILVSSHSEVREALVKEGFNFDLFYPLRECQNDWKLRMLERGSHGGLIKIIMDNWDEFIDSCESQKGCDHFRINSDQFLSDLIEVKNEH